MAEGTARLDKGLEERARRGAAAFQAAAVTVSSELLDKVEPGIPRKTGELAGSGFVERTSPVVAGWGSDHAAVEHELAQGRGFKFHQRVLDETAPAMGERMAQLHEQYTNDGITMATAPARWPSTPVTRGHTPATRKRDSVKRVRAGAPRRIR